MSLKEKIENATHTDWVTKGFSKPEVKKIAVNAQIAARITLAKQEQNLTREDIARELKVSKFIAAKWEDPEHDFTISELCKISEVLDISDLLINLAEKSKR